MQAPLTHHASPRYWECFAALPQPVRELANTNFELLKKNPQHPSLHFKQVGQFWSMRVGLHYRALGVSAGGGIVWFWIGTHGEYDRLIS